MKTRFSSLLPLACLLAGTHVQAAVLGKYVFGADNPGSTSPAAAFEATSVIAGSTFGDINLTGSAITAGNFFTSSTIAGGQPSRILSTQTAGTTVADSITNNSYFQFTVTPGAGQTIDFSSISLDVAKGGGSARGFSIASSADSYATLFSSLAGHPTAYDAAAGIAPQEDIYTNYAFDLSSLSDITTATTFRVYSWSGAATNTIYYDNITLNGSAVPEPASAALGAIGLLTLLRRRRSA
jgi:hypothetical protein